MIESAKCAELEIREEHTANVTPEKRLLGHAHQIDITGWWPLELG